LSQRQCAELLHVPVNTLRMWDSGLPRTPADIVSRLRIAVEQRTHGSELLSLDQLASELGVHQRTLRDAVRAGRLEVQLLTRSAFGRPIRRVTRHAGAVFMERYYNKKSFSRFAIRPPVLITRIPPDYDRQLTRLRRKLRLTPSALAVRIGAAGKAVIYQWESRKRQPSIVFWQRVLALRANGLNRPRLRGFNIRVRS
jgi:DNA-binding transcriptional regulator YiaG